MNWRDVPMPPRVATLPRDGRGFPVPWISDWHVENEPATQPKLVVITRPNYTYVGLGPSCPHVAGVGTPDLGKLCPANAIKGAVERLCDVCGGKLDKLVYFIGGESVLRRFTGFREIGLHYECALYSAQVCPGIRGGIQNNDIVRIWECARYELAPEFCYTLDDGATVDSTTFPDFNDPRVTALIQACNDSTNHAVRAILMGVYCVPQNPTVTPLGEWVQREKAKAA